MIENLLSLIDPIYDAHCKLLGEIELRLSNWEPPFIGDIMSNFCENLQVSSLLFLPVVPDATFNIERLRPF